MVLTHETEKGNLLALIGVAIEQLQKSIEYFETHSKQDGAACLSTVIQEIDSYLDHAHEDPLVRLASVNVSHLSDELGKIKCDLLAVVAEIEDPTTSSHE
jgi:hypothetical protein